MQRNTTTNGLLFEEVVCVRCKFVQQPPTGVCVPSPPASCMVDKQPCSPPSPVFCYGQLLASIQNASIFNDSKEFVDRPLTASPDTILNAFNQLPDPHNITALREFVKQWTLEAGSDLETWTPPDWTQRWDSVTIKLLLGMCL